MWRWGRLVLGWGITLVVAYLVVVNVPLPEVWQSLTRLPPLAVVGAMTLVSATLWLRGERWSRLLSSDQRVAPRAAAELATLGLALNALLPGRLGELARIGLAKRRFGLSLTFATATVVVERLLDGVTLFLLLGLALLSLPSIENAGYVQILGTEVSGEAVTASFYSLGAACLALTLAILALTFPGPRGALVRLSRQLPGRLPKAVAPRLEGLLAAASRGVSAVRSVGTLLVLVALSGTLWLAIAAANLLVAWGMDGIRLSVTEILVITAVTVAVSSLPSAPGGWGVFEAGGMLALRAMQPEIDPATAFAYIISCHVCQYAPTVAIGYTLWLAERRRNQPTASERPGSSTGTPESGSADGPP